MDPLPIVTHLSETIGIRFCGTDAEHESADYLAEQLAVRGLQVHIEPVRYIGWELHSEPTMRFLAPEELTVTAYPLVFSLPTPGDGIEGHLRLVGKCPILGVLMWDKYEVILDNGEVGAWVFVRE